MIHIEDLSKVYDGVPAVDRLSLDVARGEAVALWGPNGAGKSTVVRCLLGLATFEGTVEVGGLDVRRHPKATRALIGHVPQAPAFFDDLTVLETAELSAALRRLPSERVTDTLELMGLADEHHKAVGALSGGMRQRLAMAVALQHDPPVLLLDEPTSNLDVAGREAVVELLERLRPTRSLLLTSHHLEEVAMLVDRVLALEEGQVKMTCEPGQLATRLGLRSWLHVVVADGQGEQAREVLAGQGFVARTDRMGVLVEVGAQQKGAALEALHQGGIQVVDIEVWR